MAPRKYMTLAAVTVCLCLTPPAKPAQAETQPLPMLPDVDTVVKRMLGMDEKRRAALRQYTAIRHYTGENKHFKQYAETLALETYVAPSTKRFDIVMEKGSGYIRKKVFAKLMESEKEAFQKENLDQTRISPENYNFRLLGTEEVDGRKVYVLELIPKKRKKYLIKGRIWVDEKDSAIARLEGQPAKRPSFWTRHVQIVRQYKKVGEFWLPALTWSASDLLIAGRGTLTIEYKDYRINEATMTGRPVPADQAMAERGE